MAVAAGTSQLTRGLTSSVSFSANTRYLPRLHSLSYFAANNYSLTYNTTKSTRRFTVNVPKNMAPIHTRAKESSSDSPSIESVKKAISENPVVVYSKTWCSYSSQVKSLFKRLDVQPFVVELDQLVGRGHQSRKAGEEIGSSVQWRRGVKQKMFDTLSTCKNKKTGEKRMEKERGRDSDLPLHSSVLKDQSYRRRWKCLLDNALSLMFLLVANTSVDVQILLCYTRKGNLNLCCQKLVRERLRARLLKTHCPWTS
ncbi:hypothetical protein LguiB_030772 [Lonicera macranthoides]